MRQGKTEMWHDGGVSTMNSMSYDTDGNTYLIPTIRNVNGNPMQLSPEEAIHYAMQNQDALPYASSNQANYYDKQLHEDEYKRLGVGGSKSNVWSR